MLVHGAQDGGEEDEELGVLHRGFAGVQQVVAVGIAQRPVVVLARSVDARERLFMQQANVAMPPGRAAHHFHRQHVVVRGDVHVLVYGAISNWPGATSLWRVCAGMPSAKRRCSTSCI